MIEQKSLLNKIWIRRTLIRTFALSDLKIKYKNSFLGFLWSLLEPLLILSVLYFIFTNIFKTDIENYPLYLFIGIIVWGMFSRGTTMGMNSVISKIGLISSIYFPREIPAISSTITSFLIMLLEFVVFALFLIAFQFVPSISIILLAPILLIMFVLVLGVSLPLSALNVYFRDVQYIWSVILHAGFFIMPIIYSYDIFPQDIKNSLLLIPTARLIEMAHNVILYNVYPNIFDWLYTIGTSFVILIVGLAIFKKLEEGMVEA